MGVDAEAGIDLAAHSRGRLPRMQIPSPCRAAGTTLPELQSCSSPKTSSGTRPGLLCGTSPSLRVTSAQLDCTG